MIKAIIFDFYGVIRSDDYHNWLAIHGLKRGGHFREATANLDRGVTTIDEFFAKLSQLSSLPVEQIKKEFLENGSLNDELLAIILELKTKFKIGLLSNASSPHLRDILISTGVVKLFDGIIISSEIGVIKPAEKIFDLTLNDLGIKAQEAIFVDDNPKFVEAAVNLGMFGITYIDIESFKDNLRALGIMV